MTCTCPPDQGHTCPPPWVEGDWPTRDSDACAVESGSKKCPEPAATDPGPSHYLSDQEATPMSVPTPKPTPPENGGK